MRILFARVLPCSLLLACSAFAAEEAAEMLKVSPVGDRPIEGLDAPAADDAAKKVPAEPPASPTPIPEPEPTPEAPEGETPMPVAESTEETIVPEPFPVARYETLWENSPFQIESIAPPQQSEGLAQRFVLGGILRENGEPVVWIRERATQQSHKVARNVTNNLGLSLVEVSEVMGRQSEATATIRLGGELGVIRFDAAAAAGAPGMAMPPPMARPAMPTPIRPAQPMPPGVIPGQTTAPVPGQMPGTFPQQAAANPAMNQPGIVPPVPGPPIPAEGQVQAPGQEQMPPPRVIRRRAIVPAAPATP